MNMQNCSVCNVSVFEKPLYRNGPVGVIDVPWSCIDHVDAEYYPNRATQDICNIIIEDNNNANNNK